MFGLFDFDLPGAVTELKSRLPFTFRFDIPKSDAATPVSLRNVPRQARAIVQQLVSALGRGWQATIFPSHIILYKEQRHYPYGQVILPETR
ncbi:MAG TPA: hypothetical protein VG146_17740 [Verrucomicrobiae bacterium]|nr:hypothetical protein [Verrucomicrobiae bacterium]